jgi:membrane protease YdiL (CAAX protease family)
MAQYDTQYTAVPEQLPPRRKLWPLAGVMVIDLFVIVIAVAFLMIVISTIFIVVRASLQGNVLLSPDSLSEEQVLRLLGPDGVFVVLLAQNAVFVGVPVLRVAALRREPLAEIGFQAWRPLRLALIGLGLGLIILIGNVALGYLFSSAGIEQNQAAQYPLYPGDYAGQALFLVGAAILAPVGEEVLFRGYVFNAIRQTFQAKRWGVPLAYLLSALGFMTAHSLSATQGLIGLLIPTFLMGLVLAMSVHRTGSLLPGIIAHALNNTVALSVLLVCVNTPGLTGCPAL